MLGLPPLPDHTLAGGETLVLCEIQSRPPASARLASADGGCLARLAEMIEGVSRLVVERDPSSSPSRRLPKINNGFPGGGRGHDPAPGYKRTEILLVAILQLPRYCHSRL